MARSKVRTTRRPGAARPPKKPLAPVTRSGARLAPAVEGVKHVLVVGWANGTQVRLPTDFAQPGWQVVRFDCDPASKPELLGPLEDWSGIPDASLEAIWMPQLLQRLPHHLVMRLLREARRALVEGGTFALTVPNAQIAASYVATGQPEVALYGSPIGPITPSDLLYGLRAGQIKGEMQHYHRSGWGVESLGLALRDTGFSNARVEPRGYEILGTARAYSFDHPDRVERIVMTKQDMNLPVVTAPPLGEAAASANSRPRVAPGGKSLPDELDLEPTIWTPLGLK